MEMMGKPYASLVENDLNFDFTYFFFHLASRTEGRISSRVKHTVSEVESKFILMLRSVICFRWTPRVYRSAWSSSSPPMQTQMRLRLFESRRLTRGDSPRARQISGVPWMASVRRVTHAFPRGPSSLLLVV